MVPSAGAVTDLTTEATSHLSGDQSIVYPPTVFDGDGHPPASPPKQMMSLSLAKSGKVSR